MSGPRPIDATVLARYLSGESTPAEVARVRDWLREDRARNAELDELRRMWLLAGRAEPPVDAEVAWERVRARMHDGERETPRTRPDPVVAPARRRVRRGPVLGSAWRTATRTLIAAGVAIAATTLLLDRAPRPRAAPERKVTSYATSSGQRAIVELADGTQIALAPESHLQLSQPVGTSGVRDAYLIGEAVFTVAHDTARPFVVHAKGAVTIDVGTRFGVRAYADSPLRVAVAEGHVAFADDVPGRGPREDTAFAGTSLASLRHATMLSVGDVVTRTDDSTDTVSRGIDVDALLDWSIGRLTFDRTRFGDLIPDLRRWYGLTIRVTQPSLLAQRVSGQFESESPDEIVRALARALGARYTRHGTTVTFTR